MLQTWGTTVWSGLSVTGSHNSDPLPLNGADFVRIFASVEIQSFTYVQLAVELLESPSSFRTLYDPSQTLAAQRWMSNYTYTTVLGAFSTAANQRIAQLALGAACLRFAVTVFGSSGTPGSLTLIAQGIRRRVGSYQSR